STSTGIPNPGQKSDDLDGGSLVTGETMDANEIIKAAPEIAKIAAPLAAAIPFTAIVKRMLGPAADEFAEMWRDQVRLYRYERQLKCVEKAERMAQEAG